MADTEKADELPHIGFAGRGYFLEDSILVSIIVPGKPQLTMKLNQWYALGEKAHTLGVDSGTIESSDAGA